MLGLSLFSQAPSGISYQTIIRDSEGQAISNKELKMKITIRSGTTEGEVVYAEMHPLISNGAGLITLVIGRGEPLFGSFQNIGWGKTAFYFETSVDFDSTGEFLMMGTTQFLAVPYAMFSKTSGGILCLTEQERNDLVNPKPGMQIFNTSSNCLNYFNGSIWFETCGNQVKNLPPSPPSNPSPPDNATDRPLQFTLDWQCLDPENDPMTFDVYFGLENPPQLYLNGISISSFEANNLQQGFTYYWKVVANDGHGNSVIGPQWSFTTSILTDPEVDAGPDQTVCKNFSVDLSATATNYSNIQWITGGFGVFTDENSLQTVYIPSLIDYMVGFTKLTVIVSPVPPSTTPAEDSLFLYYIDPPTTPHAGPDQTNLPGNATTLQANTPESGTGSWSIISGNGGIIENPSSPVSQFIGNSGEIYVLQWSIVSPYCTLTDDVKISFQTWSCGMNLFDTRDNQQYSTKLIGSQCWMTQSLNIGTRIGSTSNQANNSIIEKYCYQDNDDKCSVYGGLYQWNEMMQYSAADSSSGICPIGWHIPSHYEFIDLIHSLGDVNVAGGKMKSTGTIEAGDGLWAAPNAGATNSSGFTGNPGGFYDTSRQFYYIGYFGYFWTSTQNGSTSAWYRGLYNYGEAAHSYSYNKNYGFSVRCVKD